MMQPYIFQTYNVSMVHPDFLKLFYGFTFTQKETRCVQMKENCGVWNICSLSPQRQYNSEA